MLGTTELGPVELSPAMVVGPVETAWWSLSLADATVVFKRLPFIPEGAPELAAPLVPAEPRPPPDPWILPMPLVAWALCY